MAKNNIVVTRKPYEAKGALTDLQILSAGNGQLPIKQGKPIERYGGYNKIKGAYFCVVEHSEKKSRVRSIEPVYIYKKALYESDPIAYCSQVLGLVEPRIIYPRLLTDTLVEIDGKRVYFCGRTGSQLLCKHSYQLCVPMRDEKYIKAISKYVSRSLAKKAEDGIKLAPNSEISAERNCELYEVFREKLHISVYNRLFSNASALLDEQAEKFTELPLFNQCKLLLEVLKLFKCDRQLSDLKQIGGSSFSGILRINKSLKKVKSAYVINSSVTGMYQYRTDLLK